MAVRAIIFDCFGVLIEDALKVLRDELGQTDPAKAAAMIDILHASHRGLITPAESNRQVIALLGFTKTEYRKRVEDGEIKNRPLMEYILELRQSYKTAILSNVSIGGITRRFTSAELETHFDAVVASGEIGYAKPEAEAYEIVADRLGLRLDECVFTDDNQDYCEAARGIGMQAILFENVEQFKADLKGVLGGS